MEAQLKVLDDLMKVDRQSVRRLTIWTVTVWAVWVSMMVVGLGLPMVLSATAPRPAGPPRESVTATSTVPSPVPAQGRSNPAGPMGVVAASLAVVLLAVFYSLPIAGVILLVMMIAARRSATTRQIQASLVSIDAQLKLILVQKTSSTGP